MIRTNMYFPKDLYQKLQSLAQDEKKSVAELVRKFVEFGLEKTHSEKQGNAHVLLQLAEIAKKYQLKGPKDLSLNHNKYFVEAWEESKGRKKKK